MADVRSPWFPYDHVVDHTGLIGYEKIPLQLLNYIMDMPGRGYQPPDNNEYPRCRLMKYLYYDTALPLDNPLPTPAQKKALLYNPDAPNEPPDQERGYRLFPLEYTAQSQKISGTILKCFIGRVIPRDVFTAEIGIVFEIQSSMNVENRTKSAVNSRLIGIEQALWELLNGTNINGIGAMYMDKRQHGDCGSTYYTDGQENVCRRVVFGMTMKGGCNPLFNGFLI